MPRYRRCLALNPAHAAANINCARLLQQTGAIEEAEQMYRREATGDPRPSIAERYRSREDYLARVREAARALVAERFMLEEDVELSLTFAARMWNAWA